MRDDEQQTGESVFTYEISADESLSEGVVEAVSMASGDAAVPGTPPGTETGRVLEPLNAAINPEALDSVFEHTASRPVQPRSRVTFTYHGHEVTVTGLGHISVESLDSSTVGPAECGSD